MGRLRPWRHTDSESDPAAAATAAAAIAPLAAAAAAEAARRPTLAVSLVRAHAAAVRRLHELDPANEGARAIPAACHELVKMLNSVHEGVAMEAAQCLNALVTRCVDANMVREGIKAMAAAKAAGRTAPARPPPVVGVANALKASLGFRYRAAWPVALPVVAAAFDRLGAASGAILGGCIEALGEMGAHAEGLACRGQLTLVAAPFEHSVRNRCSRCFLFVSRRASTRRSKPRRRLATIWTRTRTIWISARLRARS